MPHFDYVCSETTKDIVPLDVGHLAVPAEGPGDSLRRAFDETREGALGIGGQGGAN